MDIHKIIEEITKLRQELHQLAEEFEYDFSNPQIIQKSVELDKILNDYYSTKQ